MNDPLHIIIAGDRGKVFNLLYSRKKLRTIATLSLVGVLFLFFTSGFSISLFTQNHKLSNKLLTLQEKFESRVESVANNSTDLKQRQHEMETTIAKLTKANKEMAAKFKAEKEELLANAVGELNERNEIIEKIFGSIGIKLPKIKESSKNSGGPFIVGPETDRDSLLFKTDTLIKSISSIPLGKPINGVITSLFGKRKDPVNGKRGFHTGLDIRGKRGQKIYATADGVVEKAFRNGGYGNYVRINHGNGYKTIFAHMQKYKVRKGDHIERGQLVGLVGNTGRSTGPHLHYEVLLKNKPVNPYNLIKVSKLPNLTQSSPEKK